jgi:hypothetical protein
MKRGKVERFCPFLFFLLRHSGLTNDFARPANLSALLAASEGRSAPSKGSPSSSKGSSCSQNVSSGAAKGFTEARKLSSAVQKSFFEYFSRFADTL